MAFQLTRKSSFTPSSFPSSTALLPWKYDVFLSFRGSDTRRNFTDHLYATLHQSGVHAFKDDKELERGKNISLDLLQAIRDSRFSIIIFSRNYADSTWCLDELATIFECMKQGTLTAIPVFYGVDPSDVLMQTGEYGKAFAKHSNDYKDDSDKVLNWKTAMTEVANVSGWDLQNRHEVEFIQAIVDGILHQLRQVRRKFSMIEKGLIKIDKHLQEIELHLRGTPNDVSIIGIYGMAGIGKTTIARALYEKIVGQFEGNSFLANVREVTEKYGLIRLQEQLLSEVLYERNLRIWETNRGIDEIRNRLGHKRVLIVLDDVDDLEQLKSLAGRSDWFGAGSIVIVTTRNEHLLRSYEFCHLYKVSELDRDDALQLFCSKAFRSQCPREGYENLSYGFSEYCKGLPLAIDVIGSFLYGRSIKEWGSALGRLKKVPDKHILDKLLISFDGLEETEQQIFLDIACFFKDENQDFVKRILEGCEFYPDIGIRVLIEKSLITIDSNNRLCMHDLLQEMGQEIVRRQSPEEPGRRSRLWLCKDVYHVLLNNTGTENVEGIVIRRSYKEEIEWSNMEFLSAEVFFKMKRLRLLKLQYLQISSGFRCLPNSLRYLNWNKYPAKSLPDAFNPNQLMELQMCNSNVKQLWRRTKSLKKLKVIDLSNSKELTIIPDFSEIPNLESLNLEGCIRLSEVPKSIGDLKCLVSLNLKNCKGLAALPSTIYNVKSLKALNLNGCSRLSVLSKRLGELTCLERLNLGGVGGRKLSLAKPWEFLLPWKKQKSFMPLTFPSSLSNLRSLRDLDLSYCHLKEGMIPSDLSCFPLLEDLTLSGNEFFSLPTSINQLSKLTCLIVDDCKNLQRLPDCSSSVKFFDMTGCISLETLPSPNFENHEEFSFCVKVSNCSKLIENQRNDSGIWTWLASYLHSLLKVNQNKLEQNCQAFQFYMSISGRDILEWFNFQEFGTSLTVLPPPYWCNDEWIGFAVCAIWELDPGSQPQDADNYRCAFDLFIDGFITRSSMSTFNEDPLITYDQLWFTFYPLALQNPKESVEWWNNVREIKLSCRPYGAKVTRWGFRMVYKQDIKELIQHNVPSESWRSRMGKRAHEVECCSDEEECSDGDGTCLSLVESSSKRMKHNR